MAQERRNPLPAGRYWVVVTGEPFVTILNAWLSTNRDVVRVKASDFVPGGHNLHTLLTPGEGPLPPSSFVRFDVLDDGAAFWIPQLPFPERIEAGEVVTSRSDVIQAPEPEENSSFASAIPLILLGVALHWLYEEYRP